MTQILPVDDDFAAGSPSFGSFVCLYLQSRISSSAISGIWLPSGAAFISRPAHGAYQTTSTLGIKDYNAAFHDSGTLVGRAPSGLVFRRPYGADVTVTGTFEMRALVGSCTLSELAPRGVFARHSAGTLENDGTADVGIRDPNGYLAAAYQKSGDTTLRWGIFRVNAGALTLLVESSAISTANLTLTSLLTITLTVSGTGATVTLGATLKGFGSSVTLALNTTDTSGSRVTAAGRCGFFMGSDRRLNGKDVVDLCHLFAVDEGGTRKVQDEFQRVSLAAAKQTTADGLGTAGGGYVSSAFYWDAGTYDGSTVSGGKTYTGAKLFRRNATANRSDFNHATTDDDVNAGRLLISQRPADSRFSQHRSIKVIIPTAPAAATGEVWAGIALRAYQAQPVDENAPAIVVTGAGPNFPINGSPNTAGTGYLFVCRGKTSSSVIWQLHRIVNNSHFPIASLTEFSIFPGYGTQFTMELEVYPRNVADPFGPVELIAKVDGSLLAMALTGVATTAGMLNPSTGKFVDPTGARVQQNLGEGLVVANGFQRSGSASADIDPIFEAWTQGALTNVVVLDQDQASVALATEGAASGTALNTITTPSELPIAYEGWSISNPFDSGHRQTAPRYRNQSDDSLHRRQTMRFRKIGAREAEVVAVRAHFDAQNGVQTPFNYTPPGGSATKVHYKSDRIRHRMLAPDSYELEFELESLV